MLLRKLKCLSGFSHLKNIVKCQLLANFFLGCPPTARINQNVDEILKIILGDEQQNIKERVELSGAICGLF